MLPQVVQQVDAGTPFIPRELLATEPSKEKLDSWSVRIRDAHRTGAESTPDNYMDVSDFQPSSLSIIHFHNFPALFDLLLRVSGPEGGPFPSHPCRWSPCIFLPI